MNPKQETWDNLRYVITTDSLGNTIYRLDGEFHRENGPAVIGNSGTVWCKHNAIHREDGPAIEYVDGTSEYWLDGQRMSKERWRTELIMFGKYPGKG